MEAIDTLKTEHLRGQIHLDSRQFLPAIESALATEDRELVQAFERIERDRIGPGVRGYLHAVIESLSAQLDPLAEVRKSR